MLAARFLFGAAALAAAGCASTDARFAALLESPREEVRHCAELYRVLDAGVDSAGVRDAQYAPLPGFPYLRVDRVTASLRDRAAAGEPALHAFTARLLELDFDARRHEVRNLPAGIVPGLDQDVARDRVLRRVRECGLVLRDADLANPEARAALLAAAQVADDYSTAMRVLGLYYLTRYPFASGARRWEHETAASFRGESSGEARGEELPRVRYAPPGTSLPYEIAAGVIGRAALDPLGQPALSERELDRLAAAYAPSFEIAVGGDYDRFGWLRWRRGQSVPQVDATEPTVYVQSAYTRYRDQLLLQLVYTVWFPERPASGASDLLAGRLDGLVWRVTLAPDGEPLIYDSIHPCGCYHQFFPTPRAHPRPAPDPLEEWAFAPQVLPRVAEGERPVLRIASATHYLERVELVRGSDSLVRYTLRPYDELRSLPRSVGDHASLFRADGLVAGSERLERFLFWPMGIASAGAMRQWGRHATAFVGRRHFDDADLIEKRFELDL